MHEPDVLFLDEPTSGVDPLARRAFWKMINTFADRGMDLNGVERIELAAKGSADNITVNDLTGTDVKQVAIDLTGSNGAGDGAADTVTLNATGGNDHITVASSGASVVVSGLSAQVTIDGAEAANDTLVIHARPQCLCRRVHGSS